MDINSVLVASAVAIVLPVAFIFVYLIRGRLLGQSVENAQKKAKKILAEAKEKESEALIRAQEKAIKVLEDAKREEHERRQELHRLQARIEKREEVFDKKLLDLEKKQSSLQDRDKEMERKIKEIEEIREQQLAKLTKVANLSQEEARNKLIELVERQSKEDLFERMRKLDQMSEEELEQKAKSLLSTVLQRCSSSHSAETTTTAVTLPSDEMKGRIIGREGRNIKTIENLTGVEIVVDETPGTILVSGFSPIRRHLAKRALDKLMSDGRIHPGRIEEVVAEAKKELSLDIKKAGEDAVYELGIAGLDPKLVHLIGRLKYRTSYGQNVLMHSIEVARLSTMLGEELGANVSVCKKGGLLHDIGKAVDHEVQGSHTDLGYDIMKRFGLQEEIAYIAIAHHEDKPETLEGVIVKVADALSSARPGARKDTYEQYIQRLEELEEVASSFDGIDKTYAIQAGREVRVFVQPEKIDDYSAKKLARQIADRVESELKYPGEIKITVIRENRVVEYAR
ncbi:MAG: ribonuclease Y [Patescibacteria group bacterium]